MKHPDFDFRKNHYWHIRNYNAVGSLPRTVVKRKGRIREEFWYNIADKLCSGRDGHCFGLSVCAVRNWHRRSGAIARVKSLTPALQEHILELHLKQVEADYLAYVASRFAKGFLFARPQAMKSIKTIIDQEGCALVNVVSLKTITGHTVVAYDYEKDPETGAYILFVADSNHPWKAEDGSREGKPVTHPSVIRLIPSEKGGYQAGLYFRDQLEGKYNLVFGVPYQFLK